MEKLIEKVGDTMEPLTLAYCNECEDLVDFVICEELINDVYKGETVKYKFKVGRCKCCNSEVATDIDYNSRKSKTKIEAYKKKIGLISLDDISEIMNKYDIGKEALAEVAGFGKVTIKRYYEGFLPQKKYSEILYEMLNDESYFIKKLEENKGKLKEHTYKKAVKRYERLMRIKDSKIEQVANYILSNLEEVTPLALQKLLSFANGVNYALNDERLLAEVSQAWIHGPVYPEIYNEYKKYGYKPIDSAINSSHGCMLSKVTENEIEAINLVINTFGLYSPKILEKISHMQMPWLEKRVGYDENDACQEEINEESIKKYYSELKLNSKESIMSYIMECIKRMQVTECN